MLSLRLTEDEYQNLVSLALAEGARSTSDLARTAICEFLAKKQSPRRWMKIEQRMDHLESEVRRVGQLMEMMASFTKEEASPC